MARKKRIVSTAGIKREVKKAERKLAALRKKAKAAARKEINLELKALKRIHKICGDVRPD